MNRQVDPQGPRSTRHDRGALLADAARRAAAYQRHAGDGRAFPGPDELAGLTQLPEELPAVGLGAEAVLDSLDRWGSPAAVRSNGGRYFGFVNGGTDAAAQAAAILAGAWDQNAALPVMSPVAARLDAIAARWVVELLGLPASATATFCGGATVANLTGILAGRDALLARAGWSVAEQGLWGAPPLQVVTGAEAHVSVVKALRMAGFGTAQVRLVDTDDCGAASPAAFTGLDERTLVVLQAGNVNTGHSDRFGEIIGAARAAGAWVHVDGAFGLWAAASPRYRHAVDGVELADSWATDAHKWLNVPYDSGIAICARAEDLRRALSTDAAYVASADERALMQLSVQMSQRARGIEAWAMLASRGRDGVSTLIERCCGLAARLAHALAEEGAQILAPVILNQALAHFDDDATTDAVIGAVQRDGTCWAGATTWHGRRAMRLSVSDEATEEADIDAAAAAIVRCWRALAH